MIVFALTAMESTVPEEHFTLGIKNKAHKKSKKAVRKLGTKIHFIKLHFVFI